MYDKAKLGERMSRAMLTATLALELFARERFPKNCPPRWQFWKKSHGHFVHWLETNINVEEGDRLPIEHEPGDQIIIRGWVRLGSRAAEDVRVTINFSAHAANGTFMGYFYRISSASIVLSVADVEKPTIVSQGYTCGVNRALPSLIKMGWSRKNAMRHI